MVLFSNEQGALLIAMLPENC
jgi:hypothetical protein